MVAGASSWRPRAGLDWRLRERRVPRLARLRLQREVEEFLYGEEAPRATRVSGLRGAPRLVPGRLRARGAWGGPSRPPKELERRGRAVGQRRVEREEHAGDQTILSGQHHELHEPGHRE